MTQEEDQILPLAAVHITPEEWAELPVHGFMHFRGDKPWLVLGLILEQVEAVGGPQAVAGMIGHAGAGPADVERLRRSAFEALTAELAYLTRPR